jgi:hypothetical protein
VAGRGNNSLKHPHGELPPEASPCCPPCGQDRRGPPHPPWHYFPRRVIAPSPPPPHTHTHTHTQTHTHTHTPPTHPPHTHPQPPPIPHTHTHTRTPPTHPPTHPPPGLQSSGPAPHVPVSLGGPEDPQASAYGGCEAAGGEVSIPAPFPPSLPSPHPSPPPLLPRRRWRPLHGSK